MGKKAKEHRKKVEKRNRIIAQERQRYEKMTKELISRMQTAQSETESLYESNIMSSPLSGPLSLPNFGDSTTPIIQNGPQI
jgi:hypothetical protein